MCTPTVRTIRGLLFIVLALLLAGQYARLRLARTPSPRRIPPEGIAENEFANGPKTGVGKALADIKTVGESLTIFRRANGNAYPANAGVLVRHMVTRPDLYPHRPWDLMNPDSQFADDPSARSMPKTYFPYMVLNTRPDGTPIGGSKPPGSRDVLAYSSIYYHLNLRHFKGDLTEVKPTGFFLVLWDDGQVEKVPYQNLLYIPKGRGEFGYAFKGQAGVPSGARS